MLLTIRRSESAAKTFVKGDRVAVKNGKDDWYIGTVNLCSKNGTYGVSFLDGTAANGWTGKQLRVIPVTAKRNGAYSDAEIKAFDSKESNIKPKRIIPKAVDVGLKNLQNRGTPIKSGRANSGNPMDKWALASKENFAKLLPQFVDKAQKLIDGWDNKHKVEGLCLTLSDAFASILHKNKIPYSLIDSIDGDVGHACQLVSLDSGVYLFDLPWSKYEKKGDANKQWHKLLNVIIKPQDFSIKKLSNDPTKRANLESQYKGFY